MSPKTIKVIAFILGDLFGTVLLAGAFLLFGPTDDPKPAPSPTITVTATATTTVTPAPTVSRTPSLAPTTAAPKPTSSAPATPTASATPSAALKKTMRAPATTSRSTIRPALTSARAYARSVLSPTQFSCLSAIITRESGWNVYARNPYSGAYGLGQALPGSKMRPYGADWRTNGITQIKWMRAYVNARYGTPCGAWSFWQRHHWY